MVIYYLLPLLRRQPQIMWNHHGAVPKLETKNNEARIEPQGILLLRLQNCTTGNGFELYAYIYMPIMKKT